MTVRGSEHHPPPSGGQNFTSTGTGSMASTLGTKAEAILLGETGKLQRLQKADEAPRRVVYPQQTILLSLSSGTS